MESIKAIQITAPVRFVSGRTVLYVGGSDNAFNSYIEDCCIPFAGRLEEAGYKFLYLPELIGNLSPELLRYYCPGCDLTGSVDKAYRRIRDILNLGDEAGFIFRDRKSHTWFVPVPAPVEEGFPAVLDCLTSRLKPVRETTRESAKIVYRSEERAVYKEMELSEKVRFSLVRDERAAREEMLDPVTQSIIEDWQALSRKYGITLDDLERLLDISVKLSPMRITSASRIYLTGLEGNPEVKMDDLTKALYFFYLRHPEGVAFKDLSDYEAEVYHIYSGITGRDDLEGIKRSVASLVAPYSSVRDSCVSRIKRAFRNLVGDKIAKHYYISGPAGDARAVGIDRDLVIWDPDSLRS